MAVKTTKFIWMDGNFVKWQDARVHILTHAIHYGSAVFEGIHSYKTENGTAVFRLDDHIDRLFRSANALSMKIKFTKQQLKDAIKKLIKLNNVSDAYIRPLVYYGYGNIGVFPKDIHTNVAILTVPWKHYYSNPLKIMTSKFIRHSVRETVYGTKISGNYANSILAMHEARKKGFDEALMLDPEGFVSEGPAENIFFVKNKELIAPSSTSALPGITRNSILKICKDLRIKAYQKKVKVNQLKNADELFFCGTATEIAPIASIDGKKIGNRRMGEITSKVKDEFDAIVRGKNKKYNKWLAFVD